MLKKYSLLALLLASSISLPVFATDQISFSVAHDGLTSGIVESVLLKTLTNRRWNIVNNNHEEINVSLHSHGKEANLRLLFNEKKVTIITNSDGLSLNKKPLLQSRGLFKKHYLAAL